MRWAILILILAVITLIIPPLGQSNNYRYPNSSILKNNAKMAMTIIIKHRADTGQTWPNPWQSIGAEFPKINNNRDAMLVTAAMFEYLTLIEELPYELFLHPDLSESAHTELIARTAQEIVANPNPAWASCLALDWSAPRTAGTSRPCLSTRAPENDQFIVVYADTHLGIIPAVKRPNQVGPDTLYTWQSNELETWAALTDSSDDLFSCTQTVAAENASAIVYASGSTDIWMK